MAKQMMSLSQNCSKKDCCKAFCREVKDSNLEREILRVLNRYGDQLQCRKIMRAVFSSSFGNSSCFNNSVSNNISNSSVNNTNTHNNANNINSYLWIDALVYIHCLTAQQHTSKTEPSVFSLRNPKMFKKISVSEPRDVSPTRIKPYQNLRHDFCRIMQRKEMTADNASTSALASPVDVYIVEGIIHFLLKRFQRNSEFNLAILILRFFNILEDKGTLESDYFPILVSVFEKIKEKVVNSVVDRTIPEHCGCIINECVNTSNITGIECVANTGIECSTVNTDNNAINAINTVNNDCLLFFNFSTKDFHSALQTVKSQITSSAHTDIREDLKLNSLFRIFHQLHQINLKMNILTYRSFVLNSFYSKINLKSELKFFKLKFESPLAYSYTIPIEKKAEILKIQNSDLMKNSLQESFFKALFEGVTHPYLYINIRRDKVYLDSLKIISETMHSNLNKQLKVKFLGEEGIDSGGIKKEFFLLLGHEIENDISLFTQTNNRIWFRNGADLENLESIGKLVGIALYNDVVLNVPFPSLLFKKILKIPILFEDLEEIEPEIYNSLIKLKECTSEDLLFLEQNFTVDFEIQGKRINVELFPNGKTVNVTKENLNEFISLYFKFLTDEVVCDEFNAFSKGFYSVVKYDILKGISARELEKVIIGCDEIDFQIIKNNTVYSGFKQEDEIISNFWMYFSNLKLAKKKKLIQFITGNDRLPVGGSNSLNLVIMKNGCDTERLPSSQTCFNTLLLPEYAGIEKLAEKMNRAIDMTAGFFLM